MAQRSDPSSTNGFGLEFTLNYIDYEHYPTTSFDQKRAHFDTPEAFHQTVPIVRIFGSTDAGQKVCALVHGVFPYMYIEYNDALDEQSVQQNCLTLHQNINVTLATTYRRNPHDDGSTFVASIIVCKAVPFYGLHARWRAYYKISLLSPKHMSRLADLFRAGSILGRPLQPYESHVPYLLQFMIDFNLYGCNLVRCDSIRFRDPLPNGDDDKPTSLEFYSVKSSHSINGHARLSSTTVPPALVLSGNDFRRASRSELEIDILAGSIVNRAALVQRAIHHDLTVEAIYVPDHTQRILPSLTELWRDDARRREALGLHPTRSQMPQSNVRKRSNVWNNEEELQKSLQDVLEAQRRESNVEQNDQAYKLDSQIERFCTSFESVGIACCTHADLVHSAIMQFEVKPGLPIDLPNVSQQAPSIRTTSRTGSRLDTLHRDTSVLVDSSVLAVKPLSAITKKIRFTNVEENDVFQDFVESDLSKYLTQPLRLRGGYEEQREVTETDSIQLLNYSATPPSRAELKGQEMHVISSEMPEPFYSDIRDVPLLAKDHVGKDMAPKSRNAVHLPEFFDKCDNTRLSHSKARLLQFVDQPPSNQQLRDNEKMDGTTAMNNFRSVKNQITMPTQASHPVVNDHQGHSVSQSDVPLSVLSIEIHAQSRGILLPDPAHDPIFAVFWAFRDYGQSEVVTEGCVVSIQDLPNNAALCRLHPVPSIVDTELDLVQSIIDTVLTCDPDAVLSFEMQNSSLGYVEERTKIAFGFSALTEMGRLMPVHKDETGYNDRWGETHATSVKVSGRHVLNLWRIMRSEMNLLQYTLENVAFHQLRLRIPKYSHKDLHRWLLSGTAGLQQRTLKYYAHRTLLSLQIIDSQGLLSRVSEQARLLGIDFYSVFSRGSQFKVESLMFRIAKPECYMMLSPSKKQVAQQNALECLPLVMEPQSRFYHDPVIVLDFQSLYPSIMIAYNFCYSTCLGKLGYHGLESKLGVTHYKPEPASMQELAESIEIAPNGVLYVKDNRRKSLLARMLHDLLETRAMVKEGMKLCKDDKAAQKLMHNRQLALKLIANVTYGYTSASFSGRMPCANIADSIVQTGRETLEKAIEFIHNHSLWNAEVVYGDTDSLFVKLPGRSKQEAFHIGTQMALEITKMSPSPVKLKFEKVYLPCILLAKKRYVGFKYESPQDTEPTFDAKGIETVRRDGTPAEQKIEEKALKIMFRTGDLSAVKEFFQQECWKIMTGQCSLHDFCFAKEVKLGSYSTKGIPPPGAVISAKSIAADPRSEPQYGERVPYLVISGASRSRLTDRCVPPEELLLNPNLRLDVEYYITKNIIPPLDRLFCLMGVNVRSWYDEMPRMSKISNKPTITGKTSNKIELFLTSSHCPVCQQELAMPGMCQRCLSLPARTFFNLQMQSRADERTHQNVLRICSSCCSIPMYSEVACVSKDCPVYYKRVSIERKVDIALATRFEPLLDSID